MYNKSFKTPPLVTVLCLGSQSTSQQHSQQLLTIGSCTLHLPGHHKAMGWGYGRSRGLGTLRLPNTLPG